MLALFTMLLVHDPAPPEPKKKKPRPPIPAVVPEVASSDRSAKPKTAASSGTTNSVTTEKVGGYRLVSEGDFLWAPPYPADSPVASLDLLPPGPAVIVTTRLNHLVNDPSGRSFVEALSPEMVGLIKKATDRARVPANTIERLSVALHPGSNGWPEVSLVVELTDTKTVKELTDTWQASMAKTPDGSTIYAGDERDSDAFYLGDSQKGAMAGDSQVKRFAVGSIENIKAVAENEGGGIPLPRSLQKLWDNSSSEADFVALVTPNFLFADGRAMVENATPELADPLKDVLIPDFAGLLISAQVDEGLVYTEIRGVPSGGASPVALMSKLSDAIQSWPSWAEGFVVDAAPDRSWKLLATRLPQMMRFCLEHTRFGVDDDTVVANNYMPGPATSQLSVATLLAMNTKPGSATADAGTMVAKALTLDEMLNRKMSISFDQLSLEFAINEVVDEFAQSLPEGSKMPPVRMIGNDLQKSGITQNQQIRDFNKTDLPLRTVLTELVVGANPDKTATGPNDPKQALVWALAESSSAPGGKEIVITTRVAAKGTYELPDEFQIDE